VQANNVTQLVPLAANAANVAAAQIVAANGAFTLSAGTNTTAVTIGGKSYISLVTAPSLAANGLLVPGSPARGLVFTTVVGFPAAVVTFTVNGLDCYGNPVSENVATTNAGGVLTAVSKKTYSAIYSVTSDTNTVSNVTIGTTDLIGLQYYMPSFDYFAQIWFNQIRVAVATFTAGDATSPATATTGDVRGTILLPSGSDGTKRLVLHTFVAGNTKPQDSATTAGYFGVTQFANSF
jgi:hypothetical protein